MGQSYISPRSRGTSSGLSQFGNNKQKEKKTQLKDFYEMMKFKYEQMQNKNQLKSKIKQRELLTTYIKVLDKIGGQLIEQQARYQNIDKDVLKIDKLLYLSEQLNFFRAQCHKNNVMIIQNKKKTKQLKQENQFLEKQIMVIEEIVKKRQLKIKSLQKRNYHNHNDNDLKKNNFFSLTQKKGINEIKQHDQAIQQDPQINMEQNMKQENIKNNLNLNQIQKTKNRTSIHINKLRVLKKSKISQFKV